MRSLDKLVCSRSQDPEGMGFREGRTERELKP
jgi:hypothetical protein